MFRALRFFSSQRAAAFPPSTKKPQQSKLSIYFLRGVIVAGFTGVSIITYQSIKQTPLSETGSMRPLPQVDHLKSMDEITSIFKKNEETFHSPQKDYQYDLNSIPSNNPNEDYHSQYQTKYGMIYGVYDGHGGPECGAIVAKLLSSYIDDRLCKVQVSPDTGVPPKDQVIKSIKQAFLDLDRDICLGSLSLEKSEPKPYGLFSFWKPIRLKPANDYKTILEGLKTAGSGSCAIIAYLQGNEVYVANTGDCRVVMGRSMGYNNQYKAIELSKDQTAKSPTEFSRMCEEHPGEDATIVVRGRVLGGLMPSRAFGDARYKWPLSIQQVLNPVLGKRTPPNLLTPPYVTAEPEVTFYERDEADEFLVIACDGLWDEVSSNTSVKIVTELMEKGYNQNYATALIQAAISGYGRGGGMLDAARIQQSLSIPTPHSRKFRDDMTVGVLFFKVQSELAKSKKIPMVLSPPPTVEPQLYDWVAKLKNSKQHISPVVAKLPKSKL